MTPILRRSILADRQALVRVIFYGFACEYPSKIIAVVTKLKITMVNSLVINITV
jgi:hypothetical protein